MGCFDTFHALGGGFSLQLKAGHNALRDITEGERVSEFGFADGVYHAPEGVVVIHEGVVRTVAADVPEDTPKSLSHFTKWGEPYHPELSLDMFNPVLLGLQELQANRWAGQRDPDLDPPWPPHVCVMALPGSPEKVCGNRAHRRLWAWAPGEADTDGCCNTCFLRMQQSGEFTNEELERLYPLDRDTV